MGHKPHSTERGFLSQQPRLWVTEAGRQRMSAAAPVLTSDDETVVGRVFQGPTIEIWFWWCRDVTLSTTESQSETIISCRFSFRPPVWTSGRKSWAGANLSLAVMPPLRMEDGAGLHPDPSADNGNSNEFHVVVVSYVWSLYLWSPCLPHKPVSYLWW